MSRRLVASSFASPRAQTPAIGPTISSAPGYRIARLLAYAPHTAWLEASDGGVQSALSKLGELHQLADVVNVEPQLLAPRTEK